MKRLLLLFTVSTSLFTMFAEDLAPAVFHPNGADGVEISNAQYHRRRRRRRRRHVRRAIRRHTELQQDRTVERA